MKCTGRGQREKDRFLLSLTCFLASSDIPPLHNVFNSHAHSSVSSCFLCAFVVFLLFVATVVHIEPTNVHFSEMERDACKIVSRLSTVKTT
jgi:hypothetical protein